MDGCLSSVLLILAVVAIVVGVDLKSRMKRAEEELVRLRAGLESAHAWIKQVRQDLEARATAAAASPDPVVVVQQPIIPAVAIPTLEIPAIEIPESAEPVAEPFPVAAFTAVDERDAEDPAANLPPPPISAPPVPPPAVPPFDWESLVGVKLFSWIAGIALALAGVFFLKYSVEHGFLTPPIRMAFGLITGAALLVICEMKIARNYRVTGNAMDGAGIAILYSTLFASHALWELIPSTAAFALMILVTATAVLLAIRRDSIFIALLGLVGGFATPALLSTGQDRPIGLFSYLLLLNGGLAWVAYRKRWPVLSALTLLFTTIYQWVWVMRFLDGSKLPLAVGIFLIFPIVTTIALWLGRRREEEADDIFEKVAALSAALPLLFAVYAAAVPAYGHRFVLLFAFLLMVDVGLAVIAAARRNFEILHLAGAVATLLTWAVWISVSYRPAAWPSILGWAAAFILLYAGLPEVLARWNRAFRGEATRAVFAGPLLFFIFPALAAIEPRTASPALLFGAMFVLLAVLVVIAIRRVEGLIYYIAAFFAIIAQGFWSARHLTADTLHSGLLLYAVFALFFLGVPFIAQRAERPLGPRNASRAIILLSLGMLLFLGTDSVANVALFGLATLLLILNAGAFFERLTGGSAPAHPALVAAASVISWFVLGFWWMSAAVEAILTSSILVVAGFAILLIAGNVLLGRKLQRAGEEGAGEYTNGLFLALIGHFFLLIVAANRTLGVPPWPLLGAVAVLTLAFGVGAFYARKTSLHMASLVASQIIVLVWMSVASSAPWPATGVMAAMVLSAFGLLWFEVTRRKNSLSELSAGMARAAAACFFLAQIITIAASQLKGAPAFPVVFSAHLLLLGAILMIASIMEWHVLSVLAVISSSIAFFAYRGAGYDPTRWGSEMLLATTIYAAIITYPIILGRRARKYLEPYLAVVLASVTYFFFARTSLEWRGFGDYIGALPVLQAGVLMLLVWQLLRIEPASERMLNRLALVAAAALGFVTVAIPLQLDREWITIGWALEAAGLLWLYLRIPHRGLVFWSAALYAAVMVRLVFNPAVLSYHPRSATPILNWYLYTYLVPAAACFIGALAIRKLPEWSKFGTALRAAGTVLLFLLLNIEIADFYSKGPAITFNFNAGLAQNLTYTLAWAIFAIAILIAGIVTESRWTRVAALALLVVSMMKCFLLDLMKLDGLYRVASLVGLALSLAFVAILLQKYVMRKKVVQEPAV